MRPLLVFIAVVAAVFIAGALLSYPVYVLSAYVSDTGFHKALHYSILLTGLVLGICYLRASGTATAVFRLGHGYRNNARVLWAGFLTGLVILLAIEICLYLLDMRRPDPALDEGLIKFLVAVLKAVITGLTVGLIEESLYRGAIFTGLARYTTNLAALLVTSLFYAAVHFIDFAEPASGGAVTWTTGLTALTGAFSRFTDPLILDAFLSLTLLGLILGMMRWRTGNILLCTGVHAGIVTIDKVFSYATAFRTGSPYEFLVNAYDHQTGYLATFWLALVCVLYYFLWMKVKEIKAGEG